MALNEVAPEGGSLRLTVAALIEWAESRGRLEELLRGFLEEAENPTLKQLCRQLLQDGSNPPVSSGSSRTVREPAPTPTPPPVVPPGGVVEVLTESLPQDLECSVVITWGLAERGGMQRFKLSNGKQIEVKIPAGVRSGQRLRLAGQGQNGGDLYLGLQVQPQPEPEMVSAKGVGYSRLRDLLKAGKWKEADQETGKRMCEVAGRTKEGWLREADIDHFPCEDLRTIDQLWVHYSDGKFGFSVQAKIYRELGGTREYDEKVWQKFGDRVGWRVGDNWLNYSDLTFDTSVPSAHLPGGLWVVDLGCIFSRAETCRL